MDIESKIREAEVYQAMGLLEDSLGIYEEILSKSSEMETPSAEDLHAKVRLLRQKIDRQRKGQAGKISQEDVSMIKQAVSVRASAPEIRDSALALKELGLFEEAVSEYEKLFHFDPTSHEIFSEVVACLFASRSPHEALKRIKTITSKPDLDALTQAQLKYGFGLELERQGRQDFSLDLYKAASVLDPENADIKEKLQALTATFSSGSRYDYLLHHGIVTSEQLQKALAVSKKAKKSVEFILIDHFKVKKEDVGRSLSLFYGCPFKAFDPDRPIPVELIMNLKKSFLLHDLWVPLSWSKEGVEVLVNDPKDLRKTGLIRGLIKTKNIMLSVGVREDIENFINHFFTPRQEKVVEDMIDELDMIPDISFEEEEETEIEEDLFDEESSQVVKLVDQILVTAYRKGASDIHIEPSPIAKKTDIRFRMDGVCQHYLQVPNSMARGILSRLKIMAGLDIAERRLPQDGKIKFKRKGIAPFELRLATLPTTGGLEDAVLRILAKAGAMKLDQMGLNERNMHLLKRIIRQPYGLILVVGPTGSGKTTTLHAALGHINRPGIKIWTAEDPVEITQQGLRQVEVKSKIGLDFARVMRAFLRADPDVIMIGEMRDYETASIGVEASLTGHLVFSTLHTNSAPETVTRLLDMGLNPLNFSDAFLCVLAQRLTRKLCTQCREPYHPSREEFQEFTEEYGAKAFKNTAIKFNNDLTLYRPVGCDACSGSGYKGRMGIHELMEGTSTVKRLIKKQASSEDLFVQAQKDGMTTLKQDGIMKVFQGLTDIGEVRRVCVE